MLMLLVFVLLLICSIFLIFIISRRPDKKIKIHNLKEILSNDVIDINNLIRDKIITPPTYRDIYLSSYTNQLFDVSNKKVSQYGFIDNHRNVNFLTNYHYSSPIEITKGLKDKSDIIILDGEPSSLKTLKLSETDTIITTKRESSLLPDIKYNNIYLPYYAYFNAYEKNISSSKLLEKNIHPKTKFCAFAYSNCDEKFGGVRDRKRFYYLMQKMSGNRVDNLGRCYGGQGSGGVLSNDNIFSPYKFVVAFENEQILGYISEKITNPMLCGSIPIYLGASDVVEHFNPKSFINVSDFDNFESCINHVLKIDADDKLYQEMLNEKWFRNDKYLTDLETKGSDFYKNVYNVIPRNLIRIPKYFSNNVILVTFSPKMNHDYQEFIKEILFSNYFDMIHKYTFDNLENENIKSPESQSLLQSLNKCNYNDYLIWTNHNSIIKGGNSKMLLDYLDKLNEDNQGILSFSIKGKLTSKLIIIKKTDFSIEFVKEWNSGGVYNEMCLKYNIKMTDYKKEFQPIILN